MMDFSFEVIVNTILYVGALQGIILTLFLFNVKSNIISNRLLGILTSSWAVILTIFALQSDGLFIHYPHLLKTFTHLEFTWFPLLYLSIKYLISSHKKFRTRDYYHFIPMLFNILLYSGFYFNSALVKLEMARGGSYYYQIVSIISDEILSIQGIVYTIMSLVILNNYGRNIQDYQSNIDQTVIKGIRIGVTLSMVAWIIGIIGAHLQMLQIDIGIDLFLFVYLFFVLIIYIISFIAIRSPEVYKLSESQVVSFVSRSQKTPSETNSLFDVGNHETAERQILQLSMKDDAATNLNNSLLEFMDENTLVSIIESLLTQKEFAKYSDIQWLEKFKKEIY